MPKPPAEVISQIEGLEEEILLLEPRSLFDACLVGVVRRFHDTFALYDERRVIEVLAADTVPEPGEDPEELASEHYEFNIVGAWVGGGTPGFLVRDDALHVDAGTETTPAL